MLKTKVFSVICLVCFLLSACGEDNPARAIVTVAEEPGYVHEAPLYEVVIPDSLKTGIIWNNSYPLLVHWVMAEEFVENGDTILIGTDPFFSLEMERVGMALNIAEALRDSSAVDSLYTILTDSSSYTYITSPSTGAVGSLPHSGITLQPGDTVAVVKGSPPDSVYILVPTYSHIKWPENLPGCTVTDLGLQCSGPIPGTTVLLPGVWSVKPQYIFENELTSFLIAAGDSIPVAIIGTTDTSRIIYSVFPLDFLALTPW